ncbi:MAG: inorganic phosphate transporter, PiT family [Acidobacteriota bacterium]|jgi:PiT family inorganic phosphate transporter|nr:inorganic phosphate transporter, PiT family [Acidobacteriota bacterium]
MTSTITFVVVIILIALVFDYINGFHDAANSIATVVSTRVLSPGAAVIWAAFFNFVAFLVLGQAVAKTIGKDMVDIKAIPQDWQLWVLLCGLIGAIVWNLITWYYGIPSSSSHALVGGYAGAAVAASGFGVILPSGWTKTVIFIVLSPLIGAVLGFFIMVAVMWIFRSWSPFRVDKFFRKGQLVSAALFSLGHGGNDAQKTMGIIAGVLVASNLDAGATKDIPLWVVLICHAAIGLGTLSGGWRIVKTMGSRITKLKPVGGFSAEAAAAAAIISVTWGGIPVSTTHTITGAIVGVGATRRLSAVKWGVAGRIVWAWILTIPLAALISALSFWIYRALSGQF